MLRQWQPSSANWQLQKPHRECSDESVANRALRRATFCGKQNALECGKVSDRLQIGIAIKSDRPQRQRAPMWQAAAAEGSKWHVASAMLYVLARLCACVCVEIVCVASSLRRFSIENHSRLAASDTAPHKRQSDMHMHACCSIPYKMATRCDNK